VTDRERGNKVERKRKRDVENQGKEQTVSSAVSADVPLKTCYFFLQT